MCLARFMKRHGTFKPVSNHSANFAAKWELTSTFQDLKRDKVVKHLVREGCIGIATHLEHLILAEFLK